MAENARPARGEQVVPQAGRHLHARVRDVPLPPARGFRAGAIVVHAEQEQRLGVDRRHGCVLPDRRREEDEAFDLGMLGRKLQGVPTVFRPAGNAEHAGLPRRCELHLAACRLGGIRVGRGQEHDASHDGLR
jgi:hypothetical protein